MNDELSFDLLDDAGELARHVGWTIDVYADLLSLQRGEITKSQFAEKYRTYRAILVLDTSGFTKDPHDGDVFGSFLRILNVKRICVPTMDQFSARYIRCFADDVVGSGELVEGHGRSGAEREVYNSRSIHQRAVSA